MREVPTRDIGVGHRHEHGLRKDRAQFHSVGRQGSTHRLELEQKATRPRAWLLWARKRMNNVRKD